MNICFLNGKILPFDNAYISLDDIGLLRGYSVFDFLRTYNGKPFLLKEHLSRLRNSAKALSLTVPLTDTEIGRTIEVLLQKNKLQEAQIRILLTGGRAIHGMQYDPAHPTFAILIEPLALPPSHCYTKGAKLMTNIYARQVYHAKTTDYLNAVKLASVREQQKAIEILYLSDCKVLECSTSNFFIVKDQTVITPKESILLGITRGVVLQKLAQEIPTKERTIAVEELWEADEAFITATNKEIIPIVAIDTKPIGNGKIGPITQILMQRFAAYTAQYGKK